MWMSASPTIAVSATIVRGENTSGRPGTGIVRSGVASCAAGHESPEIVRRAEGAGGHRAGEPGDERRPPGQEGRQLTVAFPQVDVLAARSRAQRPEFGVRHRAGEGEQPAAQPDREKPQRVRHGLCDDLRRDEDADADDVRDDDGGGVDRAQAAIEVLRPGLRR